MLGAGALGRPRGMVWGGRREEGSGWGTQVYLWQIHFDIWQNQYNIVKLKKKKSQTRLSDFTFTFHIHALEKEMATHSSVLAWRISGTGEPGGLLSMGSHRVGHD